MNLLCAPSYKPSGGAGGEPPDTLAIINVDWLSFSVKLIESFEEKDKHEFVFNSLPSSYKVVELTGTNIYARRLIVYNRSGAKMLTLLCKPYSRAIPYDSALVEVANEWLYNGFSWVMDMLTELHPCYFLCLSRLDICADFPVNPQRMALIRKLAANRAYVQGKRDGSAFFSYSMERSGCERVPRCLSWGSKNSNIKWKVYNKSNEIFEFDSKGGKICHKPYIVNQWETQGWDVSQVWRCEVSICPMYKFQFHDRRLSWNDVLNGFTIEDLFVSLYMSRFVVRLNQGHSDRSNDTRIHLLADFGQTDRLRQWVNPNPEQPEVVEYAACLNSAMRQIEKPEVQVNPAMLELWKNTALECVRLGHLEKYFLNLYGVPVERYDFKLLCAPSS